MNMKVIKGGKKEIEIEIVDESENFINPFLYEILKNDDVEFAGNIKEHPLREGSRIIIRTKNGNAIDAINGAVEALQKKIEGLKEEVLKTNE
jgi:DNA-directed RNA polymerase subunit L